MQVLCRSAVTLSMHRFKQIDLFFYHFYQVVWLYECLEYDNYLQNLKNNKELDTMDVDDSDDYYVNILEDDGFDSGKTKRDQSRFYLFFKRYKDTLHRQTDTTRENILYLQYFLSYLLNNLLPYYPLLTGILIKKIGLRCN